MNLLAVETKSNFLRRCWNGSARLWQAYWYLNFIGLIAVALFMAAANALLRGPLDVPLADELSAAIVFAYLLFGSVSIWRCAYNVRISALGTLARIAVVIPWFTVAVIAIWVAL